MEDIIPDGRRNMNRMVLNHWVRKEIRSSLSKLSWRDQTILKTRNAICCNCGGMMLMNERFSFQEIAANVMRGGSEKGAEVAYHTAVNRLADQLIKDGACHIVDLYLVDSERAENKNAVTAYRYRVDCDGEWGEIHFDFLNRKIKLQRLAEWDTTKSHRYAWEVIGFIILRMNRLRIKRELPKRKRLIVWDKDIGYRKKKVRLKDGSVIYLPLPR